MFIKIDIRERKIALVTYIWKTLFMLKMNETRTHSFLVMWKDQLKIDQRLRDKSFGENLREMLKTLIWENKNWIGPKNHRQQKQTNEIMSNYKLSVHQKIINKKRQFAE